MAPPEPPTPYPVAARELLRTTLLDAMGDQLATRPWSAVSMADVASGAGVSRQTLYKAFGSRSEFAMAYVLREAERFVGRVEAAVTAHRDDPRAALAAAFEVFLAAAADNPLVRTLVTGGDGAEELLPLITTQGEPVLDLATSRLAAVVGAEWPALAGARAAVLAEAVVRLAISTVSLPSERSVLTGARVAELLGPALDELLRAGT